MYSFYADVLEDFAIHGAQGEQRTNGATDGSDLSGRRSAVTKRSVQSDRLIVRGFISSGQIFAVHYRALNVFRFGFLFGS